MFMCKLVFYFIILCAVVIDASKCKEYILIIPEDFLCSPVKLKDLSPESFACPYNSPDILTYDEFYANRSCVIEMNCINDCDIKNNTLCHNKCDSTTELPRYNQNTFIPVETTTNKEYNFNSNDKMKNESKNKEDLSYRECRTGVHNKTCLGTDETSEREENNTNKEITFIYMTSEVSISEYNLSKHIDLDYIQMTCEYTESVCVNGYYDDAIENSTSITNTIFVSVTRRTIELPFNDNYLINKNITNFDCTNLVQNIDLLNEGYAGFTHDIITKFYCKNNTDSAPSNSLNKTVKRRVNVYIPKNETYFRTKENYINCTKNVIIMDKKTMSIECEIMEIPERSNKTDDLDRYTMDFSNILIWNCDYESPNTAILCDKVQSQKYKVLHFLNCTNDNNKSYEKANSGKFSSIIKLNKIDVHSNAQNTQNKELRAIGPFIDNFQLHFLSNISSCIASNTAFNISGGRIFNLWSNDDETMLRKYYNISSVIIIKLSNCNDINDIIRSNNNNATKHLKLDIILNKEKSTNIKIFEKDDSNNTEGRHIIRALINCMYPDLNEATNKTTINKEPKLELKCEFKYINEDINDEISGKVLNYKSTTESNANNDTDFLENPELKEKETKVEVKANINEILMRTTGKFSLQIKSTTEAGGENKQDNRITGYDNTKLTTQNTNTYNDNSESTTLIPTRSSDYTENGFETGGGKDTAEVDPIVYIGAVLATICAMSIIAIIAIKIWKPTYKYYGVRKTDDDKRDNEESEL